MRDIIIYAHVSIIVVCLVGFQVKCSIFKQFTINIFQRVLGLNILVSNAGVTFSNILFKMKNNFIHILSERLETPTN